MNTFFILLRTSNFLKIWTSQVLSQVTLNLINFVIILRIFEATHSTVAVSLVWIFYAIPALFLGPFSGTIVDLVEKRKVLMWTTLIEASIILLYLFVKAKVWPIYSVIFLYSLVNQLYIPAEASTLTTVVPKKLLAAANTFFIFTIYGTFLFGYGVAGSLIRVVGINTPFIIGAILLSFASLAVFLLPTGMLGEREKINGFSDFWEKVREGYEFIRENTSVLYPLILLTLANVFVSVFSVLAPLFATEIIFIDLLDIGFVVILPIGLGALLGAGGVVWSLRRIRKKKIISAGLGLMSLVLIFFSLVLPQLPFWKIPFSMLATFFLGVGIVSVFIPAQTFIQEKTPEEFRGRVFGVLGFLFTLASIIPILLAATIADIVGITTVIFIIALFLFSLALYSLREPYATTTT